MVLNQRVEFSNSASVNVKRGCQVDRYEKSPSILIGFSFGKKLMSKY